MPDITIARELYKSKDISDTGHVFPSHNLAERLNIMSQAKGAATIINRGENIEGHKVRLL